MGSRGSAPLALTARSFPTQGQHSVQQGRKRVLLIALRSSPRQFHSDAGRVPATIADAVVNTPAQFGAY